jgi:hypothetical protein
MSTKYEFDSDTIESFCNAYGVNINYTLEQSDSLKKHGKTALLVEQIDNIANQICTDDECVKQFIDQKSGDFHPIAMTLYVLNDDLWKMMGRKEEHPEKMVPMSTIPWFYWEKEAEGRKNPYGVRRNEDPTSPLTVKFEDKVLRLSGKGGDFCGILEGRIVDRHKGVRPIFIPGSTGPKKNVAKYESHHLQIAVETGSSQVTIYPIPDKELDYIYSEHPRVFYEHGILLAADGDHVSLKVGSRRETTLRGKVLIFIGRDFKETDDSNNVLLFHVWLSMLSRTPFL